jgi:glutathione S-transferase
MTPLTLYGWPVSPYTEKTKAWLRYKRIPFDTVVPTVRMLDRTIRPAVGRAVMPTIQRDDGSWMHDSRLILDTLDAEHPSPTLEPTTPVAALVSALLELYGDEWLPMVALHYRWNLPANAAWAIDEFSGHAAPWAPLFVARPFIGRFASKLSGYLPTLGVDDRTRAGVERTTVDLIAALQTHLDGRRFLLGDRPCVGDFALFGPLWAHLERDPHSRHLFDDAPAVLAWTHRLREPPPADLGDVLADDALPDTLHGVLAAAFADQWPHLADCARDLRAWRDANPDASRPPRALGTVPFRVGGAEGERRVILFALWKAERVRRRLEAAGEAGRAWLDQAGGASVLEVGHWPRLTHDGRRVVFEAEPD